MFHRTLIEILNALPLDKNQRQDLKYYIENSGEKFITNAYNTLSKVEDYLYIIKYSHKNIDYKKASVYFENNYKNINYGACTALRVGNYFARNYDWYYSEDSEFIVKTNKLNGRFKSIGVCGNMKIINTDADKGEYNTKYDILPFFTTDGMNENGVSVSINVLPKSNQNTNQDRGNCEKLCALMLPRYILDYATSAYQICNHIKNNVDIYATPNNEYHFLVADAENTYCIEFKDNQTVIIKLTQRPFISNFRILGINVSPNKILDWSSVEEYGMGLERYEYLLNNYPQNDITSLRGCLQNLIYTKAYTKLVNPWLTEFTGVYKDYNLTVLDAKNNPSKYNDILTKARNAYNNRTRNSKTWQTMHSTIYDMVNKVMYISVQEQPIKYAFNLENDYTIVG